MTRALTCDVAVIGAGPAGLAAAEAAAKRDLDVVLVDVFSQPGGQFHMQPSSKESAFAQTRQARGGSAAIERVMSAGVTILAETEVWGVFDRFVLDARNRKGALVIRPRAVVVASGAHDRIVAFPGWTLPGVMTPGAAQRLAKISGITPGRCGLVAGSGPFLLAAAGAVLRAGGRIAEVVEAQSSSLRLLSAVAAHPERWIDTVALLLPLLRTRLRLGEVVVAAHGGPRVEAVELAPLDASGHPDVTRKRVVSGIDTLLVGYGFQPQTDLTSVLGCRHRFDEMRGGWHCVVDERTGATDVAGVFAAGEVCGVAGAISARLTGAIAGLGAAQWLDAGDTGDERRQLCRKLKRARAFADRINRCIAPAEGLADLMTDGTIVCRCEEVTAGVIRDEIRDGVDSVYGTKLWTRAGMGPCQGRMCGRSLALLIAAETGRSMEEAGYNRPRIPIRPVPLTVVRDAVAQAPGKTGSTA